MTTSVNRLIGYVGAVAFGFLLGTQKALVEPLVCPQVTGHTPISTSVTPTGQYCTYAPAYGRQQLRLKVGQPVGEVPLPARGVVIPPPPNSGPIRGQ